MSHTTTGLHHVTGATGDAQGNVNFYSRLLGLRLVKVTVNYDDPTSYHLYYGDTEGNPGSLLTFFVWQGARRGRPGVGHPTSVALSVPSGSLEWWKVRLTKAGVPTHEGDQRFGEKSVEAADPDGLAIRLVEETNTDTRTPWTSSTVTAEHAVRGMHDVSLVERDAKTTVDFLKDTLGWHVVKNEGAWTRVAAPAGNGLTFLDVQGDPDRSRGAMGAGAIHHVAVGTADDAQQAEWLASLHTQGVQSSDIRDRTYFHSIYFHEPGSVHLEMATEGPGFAVDEPADKLGTTLVLPKWLEKQRAELVAVLPKLELAE